MLTNYKIFKRLMTVLRSIAKGIVLTEAFEEHLWKCMEEVTDIKMMRTLCHQGDYPSHAYFVVRGYITLSYRDKYGKRHVTRFYREGRICGLISFIVQQPSLYKIEVSKGALLLRIDHKSLTKLYDMDARLKEFVYMTSMYYEHYKEQFRENMLFDKTADQKVEEFYETFDGLLDTRKVVLDEDIALYLHVSKPQLKRSRKVYRDKLSKRDQTSEL